MEALQLLWQPLLLNLAVALAAVLALWLASIPLRDVSIIDMAFALIMLLILVASAGSAAAVDAPDRLLLGLVGLWALRMSTHLVRRNWGHGEDPRYSRLRGWVVGE